MTEAQGSAVPDGMHSITPHLVCDGAARAIAFYAAAFGAEEQARLPGPDGRLMHAMLRIGDSPLMLVDESPEHGVRGPLALGGSPVTLHLYVPDCDAAVARAEQAGASVVMPPADMFWGDRYAVVQDPFGHRWSLATQQRQLSPDEVQRAMAAMGGAECGPGSAG